MDQFAEQNNKNVLQNILATSLGTVSEEEFRDTLNKIGTYIKGYSKNVIVNNFLF